MAHGVILRGLILLAAIGWAFAAIGWARVFNASGDDIRLDRLRQVALVMVAAGAVTAAAAAMAVW